MRDKLIKFPLRKAFVVENVGLMRGVIVGCRITSELITLSGKRILKFVCVLRFEDGKKKGDG